MEREAKADFKQRALEEFRLFWIIALYLWVFLGAFTIYRRLITDETGAVYLHYGISLIEALVIAKVILSFRSSPFGRSGERSGCRSLPRCSFQNGDPIVMGRLIGGDTVVSA